MLNLIPVADNDTASATRRTMQTGGFVQSAVSLVPTYCKRTVMVAEINLPMTVRWIFSFGEYNAG